MTTPTNPIERLASLASSRSARTDRLHEATCALLSLLEPHVEAGASVDVGGYTLTRTKQRTNVGYVHGWWFGTSSQDDQTDSVSCDIDRPIGSSGYVHGDFCCAYNGPTRSAVVAFAERAGRFVEELIEREERITAKLDKAQASVNVAIDAELTRITHVAGGSS